MTLQTRKLNLIQDVLAITDARVLTRMEGFLKNERVKVYEKSLKPMSTEQFIDTIEQSREDVHAGRIINIEDLKKEIPKW